MNTAVLLFVVIINTALCFMQYLCQRIDISRNKIASRHSIIPGTNQKFLHWQDFYMQTYGDLLGLVWLMNGFANLLMSGKINSGDWLVFSSVMILAISMTLKVCLASNHKPDWGYPSIGKISLGGISHLPYFGMNSAMAVICIIKIFTGELSGSLLYTTLAGGIFLLLMAVADGMSGHFEPLKKEK